MKKTMKVAIASLVCVVGATPTVSAQLLHAKEGPILYGHHHFYVASIETAKKFWVDTLGGKPLKIGTPSDVVELPNVFIFLRQQAPTGGTKGSTVNHVGFEVPNLRAIVDKVKAAGYPIVTRAELPSTFAVKDDLAFIPDQNTYIAFVMGPDEEKIEFVENKTMTLPISLHHVHFAAPNVDEMQAWYVKVFGARPGKRGPFESADLPGVSLTFSPASDPVAGTKGRAIDHIGIEVSHLEDFCKQLESMGIKLDRPYGKLAGSPLALAFVTDPWGTQIELSEGLNTVP